MKYQFDDFLRGFAFEADLDFDEASEVWGWFSYQVFCQGEGYIGGKSEGVKFQEMFPRKDDEECGS